LNGRKHGENMYFSFGDTVLYQNYQNDTLHGLIKIFTLNFPRTIQQIQMADKGEIKLLKAFFENGRIQAEFKDTLINEIKSEYFEEFYGNGILKRIGSFTVQEEKPNGVFKDIYENGNTESIATYNNGTQVQEFLFYHPNGQLFTKRLYNNGKLMELLESYDSQGTPRESGTLKKGNGSLILYNDDGTPSDTLIYSNGVLEE
jgi:antitoxin component YwqK of YwqJK toxin-antitoxin module